MPLHHSHDPLIIKRTPFLFLRRLVLIEFFFAFLPFLFVWLFGVDLSESGLWQPTGIPFSLFLTGLIATLQVLIVGISFASWYLPYYQIDARAITYKTIFSGLRKLAEMEDIEKVVVEYGWLGRRLGYGSLALHIRGGAEPVYIRDIPAAARYAEIIQSRLSQASPTAAAADIESVRELIAGGENQFVEFKSSLLWDYRQQTVNKKLYEPVMKNVVGFMNASGGRILIGVADDGEILGLEPDLRTTRKKNVDEFENIFNMAFRKMIGPEYRGLVTLTFPQVEGKTVCVVTVRPSPSPVFFKHKGREDFYVRAGNASQPLTMSQATRYIRDHFGDI
ncbi:MAG: PH domain-containing protein [Chloroflexi bacterium]|nr:PH domain-containing protein [Chloroflexota bacterium]